MEKQHEIYCRMALLTWFSILFLSTQWTYGQIYHQKYAVIIGIAEYSHSRWQPVKYALGDARSMENFLKERGFSVYSLYNQEATRAGIISLLKEQLAPQLQAEDAVLFFFSGHGTTVVEGEEARGYIVPADGSDQRDTYIGLNELQEFSQILGIARHQAFIMDCNYGVRSNSFNQGLAAYKFSDSKKIAREILIAGDKDQLMTTGDSEEYSIFAAHLLTAVREGAGDFNLDGWITLREIARYISMTNSSPVQPPVYATLPGHEGGEFLFRFIRNNTPETAAIADSLGADSSGYIAADSLSDDSTAISGADSLIASAENRRASLLMRAQDISEDTLVLRTFPFTNFTENGTKGMLKTHDFYCASYYWTEGFRNPEGGGFPNRFEEQEGGRVVFDHASGLMWQQSGSGYVMSYKQAQQYIEKLNFSEFAGYNDWRLPTLEEAMSLMEPVKHRDLYIDPLFHDRQWGIWTADLGIDSRVWVASFLGGYCGHAGFNYHGYFVRAVRNAWK